MWRKRPSGQDLVATSNDERQQRTAKEPPNIHLVQQILISYVKITLIMTFSK